MPVILELINQPDPADLADLEKIYADYPLPPVAGLVDWLFDQRNAGINPRRTGESITRDHSAEGR